MKDAAALERLEKVTTLLVDKTGTLTEGRPRFSLVLPVGETTPDKLLQLAASLEQSSEHPLAAAVVRGAEEKGLTLLPVKEFASSTGGGVSGRVDGRLVVIGKSDFLREEGVSGIDALESDAE